MLKESEYGRLLMAFRLRYINRREITGHMHHADISGTGPHTSVRNDTVSF